MYQGEYHGLSIPWSQNQRVAEDEKQYKESSSDHCLSLRSVT